jgi:MYXO-CTERM domain-containing protein
VCCDEACAAVCEACTAAKKGTGPSGTCGPVASGTDPDADCGQMGTGSCRGDATCDGAGVCRVPNAGRSCAQASCFDVVTLSEATTCNAAGECDPVRTSCAPYRCDSAAAACKTSCASAADCAPGGTCEANACKLKDNGQSCAAAGECTSSHCVDGVCCDTACTEQCEACDGTGSAGTCTAITGAPHGNRAPCTGTPPCRGTCNGRLAETCDYPRFEVSCGSEVGCADGGPTAQKCNGYGECANIPSASCTPFACSEGACRTTCEKDSDCAFASVCKDAKCVYKSGSQCPDGGSSCVSPVAAAADEGGCGCRVGRNTGAEDRPGVLGMVMGLAALAKRRRRR